MSTTTTQPSLPLWFYFWSPVFHPVVERIFLAPHLLVNECKAQILKSSRSTTLPRRADLYSIPENLVDPDDLHTSLGALSLSSLGPPLPTNKPIGSFVGPTSNPSQLYLVLIDREIPLNVICWIHGTNPKDIFDLDVLRDERVHKLLSEIKSKIVSGQPVGPDLSFYKSSLSPSTGLSNTGQPLSNVHLTLAEAFSDTPFSMLPCVIIRTTLRERKHHLSWDVVERATKQQRTLPPSAMTVSVYHSDQEKSDCRFFDYRARSTVFEELPEKDLPPIEVLYQGFSQFLDVWRASYTQVDVTQSMEGMVDKFASSMCRTFRNEAARRDACLAALNSVFEPVFGLGQAIAPSDVPMGTASDHPPRSDGHHVVSPNHIPCVIIGFKNEDAGTNVIPIVKLATYYKFMAEYVGLNAPDALRRSRLPTLGITIIDNTITFFGLVYVGSVVYVPLTTSMWCLPIDCGGSDRHQLYIAFCAASALLARIEADAKALYTDPLPRSIDNHLFPQIHELSSYREPGTTFNFRITWPLSKMHNRHVYKARSESGAEIVVKLARSYSPELHQLCADLGHAPELYAVQKLPGGLVAVAMEYLVGITLESLEFITPARRDKWIDELEQLVTKFHAKKFVHGDLRPPNFICVNDRIMLFDFDWGGEEGMAFYPHRRLNVQLTQGRDMTNLKITKADDKRVLVAATLDYIRGITE